MLHPCSTSCILIMYPKIQPPHQDRHPSPLSSFFARTRYSLIRHSSLSSSSVPAPLKPATNAPILKKKNLVWTPINLIISDQIYNFPFCQKSWKDWFLHRSMFIPLAIPSMNSFNLASVLIIALNQLWVRSPTTFNGSRFQTSHRTHPSLIVNSLSLQIDNIAVYPSPLPILITSPSLQLVQSLAEHVICTIPEHHIAPVLKQLYWLPVLLRIHLKILLLTIQALHKLAPSYHTDLQTFSPSHTLIIRTFSASLLVYLKTRETKDLLAALLGLLLCNTLSGHLD